MTDRYAVIGNPISHSKSPLIHKMFAEQTGQDISYEAIESPLDGFAATVERLRKEGYKGCNVTVPFKFEAFKLFEAFELATNLTERAQSARAVNTLKFEGSTIYGDNTDGAGLVRDIERNRGIVLRGKQILLVGAGGAAWGVTLPLLQAGANLIIVNRTVDKARELTYGLDVFMKRQQYAAVALEYGMPDFVPDFAALAGQQFDIVINATSAGLTDSAVPLPPGIFAPGALAYDMMYGRKTPFMKFAEEQDAQVADGLGMLVEQAAEAFYIWRDVRPETAPVIAALRQS